MLARGKEIGAPQQIEVRLGMVAGNLLDYVLNTNHHIDLRTFAGRSHNESTCHCDYNKTGDARLEIEHHLLVEY